MKVDVGVGAVWVGLSVIALAGCPSSPGSSDAGQADAFVASGEDAPPTTDSGGASRCGGPSTAYPSGTTTVAMLDHDGESRSYRVHVPPGYDGLTPVPLVFVFHGGGGSGEQIELRSSGMNEIADREGFVAVYADGTGTIRTWNAGGCCGSAARDEVDDVGFVRALLDHLEASSARIQRAYTRRACPTARCSATASRASCRIVSRRWPPWPASRWRPRARRTVASR
jgi:hypothetical protein